jgi:hypothetical protein
VSGASFWWQNGEKARPSAKATLPATLPSASATTQPHPLQDRARKLIDELRAAVQAAGIQRDDVMMPLLTAFAHVIGFEAERAALSDAAVTEASQRIANALLSARQAADAEADRFQAKIHAAEAATVQEISTAIARSADRAITRRVKVFDRNTALAAAGVLFAVAAGCLGGGYWWGNTDASTDIHETELHLQAAFRDGGEAAHIWFGLMAWNDIRDALKGCRKPGQALSDPRGQACLVPLWLEQPVREAPVSP